MSGIQQRFESTSSFSDLKMPSASSPGGIARPTATASWCGAGRSRVAAGRWVWGGVGGGGGGGMGAEGPGRTPADGIDHATPKSILIWEEIMPTLVGFGTFAALPEER